MADEGPSAELKAKVKDLLCSKGPPDGPLKESDLKIVLACVDILARQQLDEAELLEGCSVQELMDIKIPLGAVKRLKAAFPEAATAAAAAARGGGGAAAAAPLAADQTYAFLRKVLPESGCPAIDKLREMFEAGVQYNGKRVLLPVDELLYQQLVLESSDWADWVEPVSSNNALRLSRLISSILDLNIEEDQSEAIVYGDMDNVFYKTIQLLSTAGAPERLTLKRRRDNVEESITIRNMRPDFMLLVGGTMLLKGEEKATSKELGAARAELSAKMKEWNAAYHGTVEYLLCYAAAGSQIQFAALNRPLASEPHKLYDLTGVLDVSNRFDRMRVVHIAMLTYAVIVQQHKQLPSSHIPIGERLSREGGCSIEYGTSHIIKRVQLSENPVLSSIAGSMKDIYAATKSCKHIINGEGVRVSRQPKIYTVQLHPIATSLSGPLVDLEELPKAVKCILLALQCLHRTGWGHGDLRWQNVVMVSSGKYIVIDLEAAVKLNTKPDRKEMPRAWGHDAEALQDGVFTAQSDLYMLGNMITELNPRGPSEEFAAKLKRKELSVEAALNDAWVKQVVLPP